MLAVSTLVGTWTAFADPKENQTSTAEPLISRLLRTAALNVPCPIMGHCEGTTNEHTRHQEPQQFMHSNLHCGTQHLCTAQMRFQAETTARTS